MCLSPACSIAGYLLRLQTKRAQGPRHGRGGVCEYCLSWKREPVFLSQPHPGSLPVSFQTWVQTQTIKPKNAHESDLKNWKEKLKMDRVSRAFRLLLRGCCSRQLTAGLPAVGSIMAPSTRLVMACTANTFNCVRSKSSYNANQMENTGFEGFVLVTSHIKNQQLSHTEF